MRAVTSWRGPSPRPVEAQPASASSAADIESWSLFILNHRLDRALLHDVELDAAVLLLALVGAVLGDGLVGAEALGDHPLAIDAGLDQEAAHALGALLRQVAVV